MNKNVFLLCFFVVFVFISCFSTPSKNNEKDVMVYFYKNPSTEYTEYELITFSKNKASVVYSVERNNALMVSEFGVYSITDGVITIKTDKFNMAGTITDEKIVFDGKEFNRSYPKK